MKRTLFLFLVLCAGAASGARSAWAKANGFPGDSCGGCHRGTDMFKPRVTVDPPKINPGEAVTLTLFIPGAGAGFYFSSNQKGAFELIPGEGVQKAHNTGVTHTGPKGASGGGVSYKVKWIAPNTGPGGVDFDLTALSTNADGSSRGDSEGFIRFNMSYGCEGVDVYLDQDGDGWGLADPRGPQRQCELKAGWTMKPGDCNDYDRNANPMGKEICNLYDDDCDGMINEGLEMVTVYKDADGDGHAARFATEMQIGCGNGLGWASTRDDCNDMDRTINPRAKEICNLKDDNCNGRIDETVRKTCGVGWCRKEASSCEENAFCQPNPPREETCNGFDDDCDDVIDNGAKCPQGQTCYKALCMDSQTAAMMMAMEPPPPPRDAGAPDAPGGTSEPSTGPPSTGGIGSMPGEPAGGEEAARPKFGCSFGAGRSGGGVVLLLTALVGAFVRRRRP